MGGEGGQRGAMTSSGHGGGCTERRGFYTEGTAALLSLENQSCFQVPHLVIKMDAI